VDHVSWAWQKENTQKIGWKERKVKTGPRTGDFPLEVAQLPPRPAQLQREVLALLGVLVALFSRFRQLLFRLFQRFLQAFHLRGQRGLFSHRVAGLFFEV